MALTKKELKQELVTYKNHLTHEFSQNRRDLLKLKIHDQVESTFNEIQVSLSKLIAQL